MTNVTSRQISFTSIWLPRLGPLLSGIILLLFAISHILLIAYYSRSSSLPNAVFPMLTNRHVHGLAAFVEFAAGVTCILYCASSATRLVVFSFIGLMLWYRFSLALVGGEQNCDCLGIMGRLFHISPDVENAAPLVTLLILTILNFPWRLLISPKMKLKSSSVCAWLLFAIFAVCQAKAGEGIIITGTVNAFVHNPLNGNHYPDLEANSRFQFITDGQRFSIKIIEVNTPRWWVEFSYDGNIGILTFPDGGSYTSGLLPSETEQVAIVTSHAVPTLRTDDYLGLSAVWTAFGLQLLDKPIDNRDYANIPLLWLAPANKAHAYGYRWVISKGTNGKGISSVDVIRDSTLDLDGQNEFYRLGVDLEDTISEKNRILVQTEYRKQETDGFVAASFKSSNQNTNSRWPFPMEGELTTRLGSNKRYVHIYRKYILKVQDTKTIDSVDNIHNAFDRTTRVIDFRYASCKDGIIYRAAKYSLQRGENLPSAAEPAKVHERETFFQNGGDQREFDSFAEYDQP